MVNFCRLPVYRNLRTFFTSLISIHHDLLTTLHPSDKLISIEQITSRTGRAMPRNLSVLVNP